MEIGANYKSGLKSRGDGDGVDRGIRFYRRFVRIGGGEGVGLLYSRRVTGIKWGMIKITRLRARVSSRDPLLVS